MFPQPIYTQREFLATQITHITPPADDTNCTICMEEYNTTTHEPVTYADKDSCKHIFCKSCLITWLSGPSVNSCAMCRRRLFVIPEMVYSDNFDEYGQEYEDEEEEDDEEDYEEDDEDEGEEDDECEVEAVTHYTQVVHGILRDAFYKVWWLLRRYRRHPPAVRDNYIPSMSELLMVLSSAIFVQLRTQYPFYVWMTRMQFETMQHLLYEILVTLIADASDRIMVIPTEMMGAWGEKLRIAFPWLREFTD
ncbi:RING domain containing protein [Pyrenophora teres f. maculata]|nr:RING domain containing protein [Pyrenophora teres f. maculata]